MKSSDLDNINPGDDKKDTIERVNNELFEQRMKFMESMNNFLIEKKENERLINKLSETIKSSQKTLGYEKQNLLLRDFINILNGDIGT